jgi:MinD-like ATPase involved in chromosome partitioning or flagellar assembly
MGKIVSVHSFRGGTGKSNLTASLSAALACRGKRVGIVDTDIQSPGIHVIFNLEEGQITRALNDYLYGQCAIEHTAYDITPAAVAAHGGRLSLIPSSIKAGEIARVLREGYDVDLLADGFNALLRKLQLDYLLIDTHPGMNEETLLSLALSDSVVLILRPDKQDYQGTAVTVEVARKLDVPNLQLVVNKVLPSVDFPALKQRVEDVYHVPVAAVLPLSEEMLELASGGIFFLLHPDHPFTRGVLALAERVA